MIKKLKNTLLLLAFLPILIMPTVELNTVSSLKVDANQQTLSELEETPTGKQSINVDQIEKALKLNTYFADRSMPLAGYGMQFVLVAEKYGLPYDFLPAIAVRESSGGKYYMNNNPFGWGSAKIKFKDFNEAIEEVGKNLAGADSATAQYYAGKSIKEKLYYYNGSVVPTYTGEVLGIMDKMDSVEINKDTKLALVNYNS